VVSPNHSTIINYKDIHRFIFDLIAETKPEVLCSFITEFDDHIFVTVDADAFFFLHDLITSYVTEKEKVVSISAG